VAWRFLVRPVWKNECWGSLELGASGQHGIHGEAGNPRVPTVAGATTQFTVDGLNRRKTFANRYYLWASYAPRGPVRGLWIKGEFAWMQDRAAPGSLVGWSSFAANGTSSNGV